jgi:hypothetical protein
MSGNSFEWNDRTGASGEAGRLRALRGGVFDGDAAMLSSSSRFDLDPSDFNSADYGGFRLAAPVAVPEPSTYVMALAGLACGGYSLFRRRRAR